jgi:hypothetical protein
MSNFAQQNPAPVSENDVVREGNTLARDHACALMLDVDPAATGAATVRLWHLKDQPGSPVCWFEEENLLVICFGDCHLVSNGVGQCSATWMRRALDQPELLRQLSGVFALFVVDKCKREILVATDRIGVQPVYHSTDPTGKIRFCTHLSWLLLENRHDTSVNPDDFFAHMAFGYVPDQSRTIYRDIAKLPPASCARVSAKGLRLIRYWEQPAPALPLAGQLEDLSNTLRRELLRSVARHGLLLGLTSGKDSLCLACHMPPGESLTGTFGAADSADHLQAAKICLQKGWQRVAAGLCPPEQIERWASYVGFHSGGLATTSYADMAWFATTCIPKDHSYVLGEGGECVRDFFRDRGLKPIDWLSKEYMTPKDYLYSVLAPHLQTRLKKYPQNLVENMRSACGGTTGEDFTLQFYRTVRMPGNFSQRHAVLATIRPTLSPFLSTNFIDLAYGLHTIHYRDSQLHRALIAQSDPSLLGYFDSPVLGSTPVQDWPCRFSGETGLLIEKLLIKHCAAMENVFQAEGVQQVCAQTRSGPTRAIFMLLRIASFALCRAELCQRNAENLRLIREGTRVVIQPPKENSEQTRCGK